MSSCDWMWVSAHRCHIHQVTLNDDDVHVLRLVIWLAVGWRVVMVVAAAVVVYMNVTSMWVFVSDAAHPHTASSMVRQPCYHDPCCSLC